MDLLAGYGSDSSDEGSSPRSPAAERAAPAEARPEPGAGAQTAEEALATLPAPDADQARSVAEQTASLFFGVAAPKRKRKMRLKGHFGAPVRVDDVGDGGPAASDAVKPLELPADPVQGTVSIGGLIAELPPPEAPAEGLDLDLGEATGPDWGAVPAAWQRGDGSAETFGEVDDSGLDVPPPAVGAAGSSEAYRVDASSGAAAGSAEAYRVGGSEAAAEAYRVGGSAAAAEAYRVGGSATPSAASAAPVPGFDALPPELASNPALLAGLREIRGDDVAAGGEEAARRAALSGGVKAALGEAAARASDAPEPGKMAKRKHQIGTLYQRAKVQELDDLQKQAQGARNRSEAKRKYGW